MVKTNNKSKQTRHNKKQRKYQGSNKCYDRKKIEMWQQGVRGLLFTGFSGKPEEDI